MCSHQWPFTEDRAVPGARDRLAERSPRERDGGEVWDLGPESTALVYGLLILLRVLGFGFGG